MPRLPPVRSLRGPGQDAILPAERRDGDNSRDNGAHMRSCKDYENNADREQPEIGCYDNKHNTDYDDFDEIPVEESDEGQPVPGYHDYENSEQDDMNRPGHVYEQLADRSDSAHIYCKVKQDTDKDDFFKPSS